MDAGQIAVSVVTLLVSVVVAQMTIRKREIENAIRVALVKLQGDVRMLAHELIRNRCHADQHDRLHAAYDRVADPQEHNAVATQPKDHQIESPKIVRDTRFALNAVDGDILSLELLAGEIDHQLKTALDELLAACRLFLPTSKGGRVPDRHQYKDFDVEGVVAQIEKSIKAAWKKHSDLLE